MRTFKLFLRASTSIIAVALFLLSANSSLAGINLKRDAKAENGMVATATPLASKVGVDILKKGGNAIDAAVGVGFALGVLEPFASGIGGGGFMLIRLAKTGETVFLDFREIAPKKAHAKMYKLGKNGLPLNFANRMGALSVAVPGEVKGLLTALEKYGTMNREQVMAPAIDLAQNGFKVSRVLSELISKKYDVIAECPATAKIYLEDELPREQGTTLKNKDLANTLKLIAQKGAQAFYQGPIAQKIAQTIQKNGGIITTEDLAQYQVKSRKPIQGTYRGYEIITAPLPSSGGIHLIQLLNIMENLDLAKTGFNSALNLHYWAEAMKYMYQDQAKYQGDSDFVKVPVNQLLAKSYAKKIFKAINPDKAAKEPKSLCPIRPDSGSTTHYSIVDKKGNMVAVTKTLNFFFGSGITVKDTGILLNDEMADFDYLPNKPNSIAANKKPLSNMTPTLIMKDNKPWATLGTPGGKRIISSLALIISNLIDYKMDPQEAINAPRINQYQKGELKFESRIPAKTQKKLEKKGHKLSPKGEYDLYFGGAQAVLIDQSSNKLHGAADPRRDGLAMGY